MTLDQALLAIRTAKTAWEASGIRNQVAMEAHKGDRPRGDCDAVLDAYFETWGHVKQAHAWDCGPRRGSNWTGD